MCNRCVRIALPRCLPYVDLMAVQQMKDGHTRLVLAMRTCAPERSATVASLGIEVSTPSD